MMIRGARKYRASCGAAMTEFVLVAFVLLALNFGAWTIGVAILRYCMMVDTAATVVRRATVTPNVYYNNDAVTSLGGLSEFLENIALQNSSESYVSNGPNGLAADLMHDKGSVGKMGDVSEVELRLTMSRPTGDSQCILEADLRWKIPCFFCHWFKTEAWTDAGAVRVKSYGYFEDMEFRYCDGQSGTVIQGCSLLTAGTSIQYCTLVKGTEFSCSCPSYPCT